MIDIAPIVNRTLSSVLSVYPDDVKTGEAKIPCVTWAMTEDVDKYVTRRLQYSDITVRLKIWAERPVPLFRRRGHGYEE